MINFSRRLPTRTTGALWTLYETTYVTREGMPALKTTGSRRLMKAMKRKRSSRIKEDALGWGRDPSPYPVPSDSCWSESDHGSQDVLSAPYMDVRTVNSCMTVDQAARLDVSPTRDEHLRLWDICGY